MAKKKKTGAPETTPPARAEGRPSNWRKLAFAAAVGVVALFAIANYFGGRARTVRRDPGLSVLLVYQAGELEKAIAKARAVLAERPDMTLA